MSDAHAFDTAIALTAQGDGAFAGQTSPAYANFIGPFGGITAAQLRQRRAAASGPARRPRRAHRQLRRRRGRRPLPAAGAPARTNRSTQHWIVEMLQGGETVATATVVTALRRDHAWGGHEAAMPAVARPADVPRTQRQGVEWLHRYDMRFVTGSLPRKWEGEGAAESLSRLWVRDEPPRPLDHRRRPGDRRRRRHRRRHRARFARGYIACVTRRSLDKLAPLVDRDPAEGGQAHGFGSDARKEDEWWRWSRRSRPRSAPSRCGVQHRRQRAYGILERRRASTSRSGRWPASAAS
jgi:hypothetical protein